jgi:hypothetical protein
MDSLYAFKCKHSPHSNIWNTKVKEVFRLRNVNIVGFYYLFNCYMFRSYDYLQAEIYLLERTLLTTDPLLLEY